MSYIPYFYAEVYGLGGIETVDSLFRGRVAHDIEIVWFENRENGKKVHSVLCLPRDFGYRGLRIGVKKFRKLRF